MKQRMRRALDHRLPITELSVVAALLDPSQRNLASVQEYVTSNGITAVELLTRAINRYMDEDDNRPENASVDEATDRPIVTRLSLHGRKPN